MYRYLLFGFLISFVLFFLFSSPLFVNAYVADNGQIDFVDAGGTYYIFCQDVTFDDDCATTFYNEFVGQSEVEVIDSLSNDGTYTIADVVTNGDDRAQIEVSESVIDEDATVGVTVIVPGAFTCPDGMVCLSDMQTIVVESSATSSPLVVEVPVMELGFMIFLSMISMVVVMWMFNRK